MSGHDHSKLCEHSARGGHNTGLLNLDGVCVDCGRENADFHVTFDGSLALLHPNNERARTWVDENIGDDAEWFGGAVVVLREDADGIVEALEAKDFLCIR
jgi:hypothetical protein